jgi:hypothetical protein
MSLQDDIRALQSGDYETGWAIFNRFRTKRAVAKAELFAARKILANELVALEQAKRSAIIAERETYIAQRESQEADNEFERQLELKLAVHSLDMALKEADKFLLEEATKRGMRVENFQALLVYEGSEKIRVASELELEKGRSNIRIREEDEASRRRIQEEDVAADRRIREEDEAARRRIYESGVEFTRRLLEADRASERKVFEYHITTQTDINKHKQLSQIDLDNKIAEMRESVRLGIIAEHLSEMQKVILIQELMDEVNKQIGVIELDNSLPPRVKQRMIEDREEIITTFKEARRGRQEGLLQIYNRQDVEGVHQASDVRGYLESAVEADELKVPSKRHRRRRRKTLAE